MPNQVHASTLYGTASSAVALDPALVAIKILDVEPETEALVADAADELELKPLLAPLQPQSSSRATRSEQQTGCTAVLQFLVALAPNAVFACASGALGVVGAAAVAVVALVVLLAARVAQIFDELALMLVTTDQALLQFSTGEVSEHTRIVADASKLNRPAVGEQLNSVGRSLLILSSDLLAIGFFKGTLAVSYCSSLYVATAVSALLWSAADGRDVTTASAFYDRQLFGDSLAAFVVVHAALWLLALGWLIVTASMSRFCSQNLRRSCE